MKNADAKGMAEAIRFMEAGDGNAKRELLADNQMTIFRGKAKK